MDHTEKLPNALSLCTGYGGIERGLELAGFKHRVAAHVEIEAFAVANLVAKMEKGELGPAPIWTDLKTLPCAPFRGRIGLLTGGYPCQPFSPAGRRKGADDPRHLWPHILRIVEEVRPELCFFENVEGHISLGLREVLSDLESRGYKTAWGIFSAEEVGAPHRRKRVFILADARSTRAGSVRPSLSRGDWGEGLRQNNRETSPDRIDTASKPSPPGSSANQWPSGPDEPQREWEAPRTVGDSHQRGQEERGLYPRESPSDRIRNGTKGKPKPGLGGTTNGPADRVDRLRLLGNGVVPQTAALAFITLYKELADDE